MVKRCAARGCNAKENQGLMLFKFPKEPERRMKWILLVNRANWQPITNSVLCEIHFGNEQWEQRRIDGSRRLKWSAVPSLLSSKENSAPAVYNPIVNEHNYCHLPGSLTAETRAKGEVADENAIEVGASSGRRPSTGVAEADEDGVELSDRGDSDEKPSAASSIGEISQRSTVVETADRRLRSEDAEFESSCVDSADRRDAVRVLQQQLRLRDEQLVALQKKFDAMQKVTKRIYSSYCDKKRQNDAMRSKLRRLRSTSESSDASVANRLRRDQFEGLRSKTTRGKQWSIPTIIDGLMYKMKWGAQDYSNFVKDFPIFPAVRTLQRLAHKVQHVKFETGK